MLKYWEFGENLKKRRKLRENGEYWDKWVDSYQKFEKEIRKWGKMGNIKTKNGVLHHFQQKNLEIWWKIGKMGILRWKGVLLLKCREFGEKFNN